MLCMKQDIGHTVLRVELTKTWFLKEVPKFVSCMNEGFCILPVGDGQRPLVKAKRNQLSWISNRRLMSMFRKCFDNNNLCIFAKQD